MHSLELKTEITQLRTMEARGLSVYNKGRPKVRSLDPEETNGDTV